MKTLLVVVFLACLCACALGVTGPSSVPMTAASTETSFVAGTSEDEAAIRSIVQSQAADQVDPHVAADLDWENAFGIRYTDLKKRDAFYGSVVKPQMKSADDSTLEVKVRFIEPTLAVADEYWHVAGQVYAGETKPGPDRWGRTTYCFKKEKSGWTEVLERVADLRYPYYKHYESLPAPVTVPAETLASYAGIYSRGAGKKPIEVAVNGGELGITSAGGTYLGIPISATEFLVFNTDDLAEYNRVTFGLSPAGDMTYTFAEATGQTIAVLTKVK